MTGETTFFQDSGATVTNTRFVTNGQTHALSGITSVSEYVNNPSRKPAIVIGLLGVALCFLGRSTVTLGILLLVLAIGLWILQKATYSVLIRTAAGDSKVLTDPSAKRVSSIISALNDAIVHRG